MRSSNWLFAILLLALLVRGLLPQGWMPAARAGGVELVICTAAGAVEAQLDMGSGEQPGSRSFGADPVCGFAGANPPAAPPVAPELPPIAGNWLAVAGPAGQMADSRSQAPVRLPPSRGPPHAG